MPKIKILVLFSTAIFIAGMLSGCSSDTPLEPYESPLTGTWSETYRLLTPNVIIIDDVVPPSKMSSILDESMADEGNSLELVQYTSVITFDNFNFELKIFDSLNMLHKEVKGDVDYKGDRVILTAKYSWYLGHELRNIEYDPYTEYSETLMIGRLDSETLVLNTESYFDEATGMVVIAGSSFIWHVPGTLDMKISATYSREE